MRDREALPTTGKFATPMTEINAVASNPDRLARTLQIARWIVSAPDGVRPLAADAWPHHSFVGIFNASEMYGKHRKAVMWVESQNASRLRMLAQCLLDLEAYSPSAKTPETAQRAATATQHIGGLLVALWGVGPNDLPSPKARPYVSLQAWAQKRTVLPECLPLDQRTREFESEESQRRKSRDFTGAPSYRRPQ